MKRKFRSKWDKYGNARIIATAFQTSDQGNRTTLLLQARQELINASKGRLSSDGLARLANAIDYSLILAESVKGSEDALAVLMRAQEAIVFSKDSLSMIDDQIADINSGLDILEQQFELHSPLDIGKARQEWHNRVNKGMVLVTNP